MVESELQTRGQPVHTSGRRWMVRLCESNLKSRRGRLCIAVKFRQHPRNINLNRFPEISDSEAPRPRTSEHPIRVLDLGREVGLQQAFFRRRKQPLQPASFFLFEKISEALLRKGMPIDQHPEMISQAFRQLRLQQRTLQKIEAALLQGPQRRHQVAAVDRRNEPGTQRLERARVVPVEQVARDRGSFATVASVRRVCAANSEP